MDQRTAQNQFDKANRMQAQGKWRDAELAYRKILKHFPQLDPVLTNLGAVLYHQGQVEPALKYLNRAIKLNPTNRDAYSTRAAALRALGKSDEAQAAYRELTELDPHNGNTHYNYANVLMETRQFAEAEKRYRTALKHAPLLHQAQHNLGWLFKEQGRMAEAVREFKAAIDLYGDSPHYFVNLGLAQADLGQTSEALAAFNAALKLDPQFVFALQARGRLQLARGRSAAALADLDQTVALAPGDPVAHLLRGNALDARGQTDAAREAYEKALELAPDNAPARRNLARLLRREIPAWHFTMLADEARNTAYRRAIEAAVRPGDIVLDIGTGSGLLAMMAARAGAQSVVACEVNAHLAEVAREIVTENGFGAQIKIFAQHSGELTVAEHLPAPARIIVSEIVDAALIGEGVLPSLRHASKSLGTPDLVMIPAGATLWAQLMHLPQLRRVNPVRQIDGFDLSRFDRFRNRESFSTVRLPQAPHRALSAPVQVEVLDFAHLPPAIPDENPKVIDLEFDVLHSEMAHGIVLWFDLHLDRHTTVSTGPDGELVHWGQAAGYFPEDVPTQVGQTLKVQLWRTDTNWIIGEVQH
ncbi:MAG: tetratricopeptide repeat protein [Bacteroidota bacterium]